MIISPLRDDHRLHIACLIRSVLLIHRFTDCHPEAIFDVNKRRDLNCDLLNRRRESRSSDHRQFFSEPGQHDTRPHRHSQLSDQPIRLYSTTSLKSISLKWWLSKTIWPICFSPNWLYHCSAHHFAPIWLFSSHCPGFFQKKPFDTVRHSTLLSKLPWKLYEHTVWLHDVTKAALVSQLTYAAPAWSVCSENFTSTRYGWFFTPRCHYVTKAALVSQLTYAAPAWSGYLSETDTNRLQSVIKKAKRFGYLSSSFCNFDELYARA